MELTYTQFYIAVIVAQVIIGALLGLIPLIFGRKRNQKKLGGYGFLATLVAGILSPLAALIAALIFVWVIGRKAGSPTGSASDHDQA